MSKFEEMKDIISGETEPTHGKVLTGSIVIMGLCLFFFFGSTNPILRTVFFIGSVIGVWAFVTNLNDWRKQNG